MRNLNATFTQLVFVAIASNLCVASCSDARADNDERCSALAGPFSSVTGPPCTSPIGLCTHGMLGGDLSARYDFTFATLAPAGDATDPTKFVYTGTSVVTATDGSGVVFTNDTGVIHINDGSPAPFVTKAIIDRGTRQFKHTIGGFVATGSLVATGEANGSYSAVLCTGDN